MQNKVTKKDWKMIEVDYRACQLSLRQIGAKHGVSESGIRKNAKKFGWVRDLSHKVNASTKSELPRYDNAQCAVLEKSDADKHHAYETPVEDILAVDTVTADEVLQSHRQDISELFDVARSFTAMLQKQVQKGTRMIEIKGEAVETEVNLKYVSKCLNSSSNAMQRLISMERQAFSLDNQKAETGNTELESVIDLVLSQKDKLMSMSG